MKILLQASDQCYGTNGTHMDMLAIESATTGKNHPRILALGLHSPVDGLQVKLFQGSFNVLATVLQYEPCIIHDALVNESAFVRVILANQIRHGISDTLSMSRG